MIKYKIVKHTVVFSFEEMLEQYINDGWHIESPMTTVLKGDKTVQYSILLTKCVCKSPDIKEILKNDEC